MCEILIEGYEIGKEGYYVDASRCLEEKDDEYLRCNYEPNNNGYIYSAYKVFGYVLMKFVYNTMIYLIYINVQNVKMDILNYYMEFAKKLNK